MPRVHYVVGWFAAIAAGSSVLECVTSGCIQAGYAESSAEFIVPSVVFFMKNLKRPLKLPINRQRHLYTIGVSGLLDIDGLQTVFC